MFLELASSFLISIELRAFLSMLIASLVAMQPLDTELWTNFAPSASDMRANNWND